MDVHKYRDLQALEIVRHLLHQVVPAQRYLFGKRPANSPS
jgi:hypothetical protein